ncbi:MAG: rhodanese-like domain-containing protein [Chloroflexi bacterium]|nr:MAG: rhodanese-like domain-containing protein [Chloroflexota bacterium]TMD93227.1 MAG: rhodanese-like domain-containing protein [Chloroflexota bacterium]
MPGISEVSVVEADRLRTNGHRILDVREDDEFAAGHISGAVHVPLMQLPGRAAELDRDADWLAVCRVGGRSLQATAYLTRLGLRVANVAGGMEAWAGAGLEYQSAAGGPGRVI